MISEEVENIIDKKDYNKFTKKLQEEEDVFDFWLSGKFNIKVYIIAIKSSISD
jgi:hypothetical protein